MNHTVMPRYALRERERFAHHAPDPLAQGVVPSLHVRGLTGLLAHALVASVGKDVGVGLPTVTEGAAATVALGYSAPKRPAGRLAPVAVDEGHDLPGAAAQRRPRPHLIGPFPYVAAHLVKLKHVIRPCGKETARHFRQSAEFFLTTRSRWRATPQTCAKSRAGSTVPGTPA